MRYLDWRGLDSAVVASLYEREGCYWRDVLSWDMDWTWATLEQARRARRLAGVVALDAAGQAQGWTFYIHEAGILRLGGVVADSPMVTGGLLDVVLDCSPEGAASCFVLNRAPGLEQALIERGFDVEPYHYLSLDVSSARVPVSDRIDAGESWRDEDVVRVPALLDAAYSPESGRHFAPTGDWAGYVSGLVNQAGCGVFNRQATRTVHGPEGLEALLLMTTLSPHTAHVGQLAVHPDRRGRGLASGLLGRAIRAAEAEGTRTMTLIVGDRNHSARRLYAGMGFSKRATFVAGRREASRGARRRVAS